MQLSLISVVSFEESVVRLQCTKNTVFRGLVITMAIIRSRPGIQHRHTKHTKTSMALRHSNGRCGWAVQTNP